MTACLLMAVSAITAASAVRIQSIPLALLALAGALLATALAVDPYSEEEDDEQSI